MSGGAGIQGRPELVAAMCHELHALARREAETAANEASLTPYWLAHPPSVLAHNAAARVLHHAALELESARRMAR